MNENKGLIKKILYISYDGMTDPLGQSQVLPYLVGLSKEGYRFTILSFEKSERFLKQKTVIESITSQTEIEWVPMSFTKKPPILSKFYDAVRMRRKAFALHKEKKFDMIHCRSYIAADIGLRMKKLFGVRFFFDMRGFWADEKRDGGTWKDNHPIFRRVYKYYKSQETEYLQKADYIISLTEAGKKEMLTWPGYNAAIPLTVIPCCADMNHFTVTSEEQKQLARQQLHIDNDRMVISYLGSVGAWYMLDEMLELFAYVKKEYSKAFFLFVTHSDKNYIIKKAKEHSIDPADMLITEASRQEVPVFIKASDINVSFIKPVYSKLSSSPTKLGEVLSMGIPVIVNSGVGDVENIINGADAGYVIKEFNDEYYRKAVKNIALLKERDPGVIRHNVENIFGLDMGIKKYLAAYKKVLG